MKTVICNGLCLGQPERARPVDGGSMAIRFEQISAGSLKGKVDEPCEPGTNLSDGDV